MEYDFSGWATRNNLKCSDGRTILKDAFKANDGQTVPLVWNHQQNDPLNVLGHALLQNKEEGVYAYCTFNDTESGQTAKSLVEHGDVKALSIYANQLKQNGNYVLHGAIREVSLVLAGANPGAYIDSIIKHGEVSDEEAVIYTGEDIALYHSDDGKPEEKDDDETIEDVFNTLSEKQKKVVYFMIGKALEDNKGAGEAVSHSATDESKEDDDETVQDVFDTLSEKQKTVVHALIGQALEDNKSKGGNDNMKHNIFDQSEEISENVLSHSEMMAAIGDAKRYGSMKESFLAHGIENVDYLFPEAKALDTPPEFIKRDTGWVSKVMGGVHHTPFSRIKSLFADITEDEARAKGYIKGNLKKDEVFSLLKRTTAPQTVYKRQKMDRDDVIDITDFDVIAWLKGEMRGMLDEELARAFLIGDGRLSSSDEKINEDNIRPIMTDNDLFTVKKLIKVAAGATADQKAKAFIRAVIKARKDYKGSGNPTLYTTEDMVSDCLLLEDTTGRFIYNDIAQLVSVLRVKEIVTVPVMENVTGPQGGTLAGIIVNLNDYNVGADKGGAINLFDDFDINYNAQKYLIETRCSGALIKPFSAIEIEISTSDSIITYTAVTEAEGTENPSAEGWYERVAGAYTPTNDTVMKTGKTYYEKA